MPQLLLVAGYFVLRFWTRRRRRGHGHPQSLLIAGLTLGWVLADALVVGIPRPLALVLALTGAVFSTVFLLTILDDLRRSAQRRRRDEED